MWSLLTDSEEGEGEAQSDAATAADADTLESIADIEEALEKLCQARSLIKAADNKVSFTPVPLIPDPPGPFSTLTFSTPSLLSPPSPEPSPAPPLPCCPIIPVSPPSLLPALRDGHSAQTCTQG